MPRGDGTGPMGFGPMTGRAAGYCAGYNVPGFMNPISGRGFFGFGRGIGFGRGFCRGRGWRFWAGGFPGWVRPGIGYPKQEIEYLKNQVKLMQEEINSINEYVSKLEQEEQEKK